MTAVTPERGEDADTVLDWLQMAEAQPLVGIGGVLRHPPICQTELDAIRRLAAPPPATDEVLAVLREIEGIADVCGDADRMTALSGLARITTCARSLLAKLEVRG